MAARPRGVSWRTARSMALSGELERAATRLHAAASGAACASVWSWAAPPGRATRPRARHPRAPASRWGRRGLGAAEEGQREEQGQVRRSYRR